MKVKVFTALVLFSFIATTLLSQVKNNEVNLNDSSYVLYKIHDLPVTPVKDQHRTGTCWDYATLSFLESEILREKNEKMDLSEMYVVRHIYPEKAKLYVRYHGKTNFGQGGQAHDAIYVLKNHGLVPEDTYKGLEYGEEKHSHGEMSAVLSGMLENIVKKYNGSITPKWDDAVAAVLDVYLGEVPESFSYNNTEYTPESFAEYTGLNPDDFIEITSYSHYPYYEQVILEVPDNWSNDEYYNVPLEDLVKIMENSLEEGYTIVWDGDVSDKYFSHRKGLALVPDDQSENKAWQDSVFLIPLTEKEITQQERQKQFDNQTSTDDHLMHLTGLFRDDLGTLYYKTKNSWGEDSNDFGGYLYMSEPYIRLNTVAVMVNKNAVPKEIAKKLKIK